MPLAPRPKLRPVSPVSVEIEGKPYLVIQDALGIVPEGVALPWHMFMLLGLCNGERTVPDIISDIQAMGYKAEGDAIRAALEEMDGVGIFEGEAADRRGRELLDQYRSAARPATHAGMVYPDSADALTEYIDGVLADTDAPTPSRTGICGIIAPHIDFERGSRVYGAAYRAAAQGVTADTFIILGTIHSPVQVQFVPTGQAYDTPLGPLEVDEEALGSIVPVLEEGALAYEPVHVAEHSIEFQALWLRRLFPEARMVGVLCSHIDEQSTGRPTVADALSERLREMMAEEPGKYCLVAGVDLTHMGPEFGHDDAVSDECRQAAAQIDRQVIAATLKGDGAGVLAACQSLEDGREPNVCGQAALYVMSRALAGCDGEAIEFGQADTPAGDSIVGFCAAALWPATERETHT